MEATRTKLCQFLKGPVRIHFGMGHKPGQESIIQLRAYDSEMRLIFSAEEMTPQDLVKFLSGTDVTTEASYMKLLGEVE